MADILKQLLVLLTAMSMTLPSNPADLRTQGEVLGASSGWYSSSLQYRKEIVIDNAKVSQKNATTLSDFPVLVSLVDGDLRSVGNGGHVASGIGSDIIFTDTDGLTALNYEIESYNPASGKLLAWVKVPALSPSADHSLYLYFGNPAANSPSVAFSQGVWNGNFTAVYHLADGVSLSGADAKGNFDGVNSGASAVSDSIIGGAANFDGATSNIYNSNFTQTSSSLTFSAWAKLTSNDANVHNIVDIAWGVADLKVSKANIFMDIPTPCMVPYTGAFNQWHLYSGVYDAATQNWNIYVDGSLLGACPAATGSGFANKSILTIGARQKGAGQNFFGGLIDEVRVSNSARSADWLSTEYNNQNSPNSFASVGALETAPAAPDQIQTDSRLWSKVFWLPNASMPNTSSFTWSAMTHLVHYGARVTPSCSIDMTTSPLASTAAAALSGAHAHGVKVLLGLFQLASADNFSACASPSQVDNFVSNIVTEVNKVYNGSDSYDGLDLDWEQPAVNWTLMPNLLMKLRARLSNKLLTADAQTYPDYQYWGTLSSSGQPAHSYLDELFTMVQDSNNYVGDASVPYSFYSSPIYSAGSRSTAIWSDNTIVSRLHDFSGVPYAKMSIAAPFFGYVSRGGCRSDHGFSGCVDGITGPYQTFDRSQVNPGWTRTNYNLLTSAQRTGPIWDNTAKTLYSSVNNPGNSSDSYAVFGNPQQFQAKFNYVNGNNPFNAKLRGLASWEVSEDYFSAGDPLTGLKHPLMSALSNVLSGAVYPAPIIGDFNLDSLINSIDLSLLVSSWNQDNGAFDLNHDGNINSLDYTIMVQNWSL